LVINYEVNDSNTTVSRRIKTLELQEFTSKLSQNHKNWEELVKTEDENRKRPKTYTGKSERTQRHKRQLAAEAAKKNGCSIHAFFEPRQSEHPQKENMMDM
jgi:hypothetical protein